MGLWVLLGFGGFESSWFMPILCWEGGWKWGAQTLPTELGKAVDGQEWERDGCRESLVQTSVVMVTFAGAAPPAWDPLAAEDI